jgi:hypothetical protein
MAIRCRNTPGRVPSNASEHSMNISMIRLSGSAPPAEVHLKLPLQLLATDSFRAAAADSDDDRERKPAGLAAVIQPPCPPPPRATAPDPSQPRQHPPRRPALPPGHLQREHCAAGSAKLEGWSFAGLGLRKPAPAARIIVECG